MLTTASPPASDDLASTDGGRWELSSLHPAIDSPAYAQQLNSIRRRIDAFTALAAELPPLEPARLPAWVAALLELEALEAVQLDLLGYLDCLRAENAAASEPPARLAEARGVFNVLTTAAASLLAALGSADDAAFAALCAEPALAGAQEQLRTLRRQGRHALAPDEERFIADAAMDGLRRWANLAAETIATTPFEVALPTGERSTHSMAERYDLMWDARPEVRLAAYKGVEAAFAPKAGLLGECFNATAGFEQSRARRRGRDLVTQILEDDHRMGRATIDTMQSALRANAPVLHAYLKLKARLLGLPHLGMQDRSAPLPAPEAWGGGQPMDLILACFNRHCPPLADHARHVQAQRWIESEPRPGKRTGGFCALFPVARETRVFVTLGESLNSIAGLAHELGHAFHDHCNFDQRWWAQQAPAALCETAAILCEHFLRDSIARDPDAPRSARIAALTSQLDAAVNYMLRIPRDFEFELDFLRERESGDVSVAWLRDRMAAAHAAWFGEALQGDGGDSLSWAYNHIMMEPGLRLYNFPYSFGYLLSRRIADAFYEQGPGFTSTYIGFLRASGSMMAEDAVVATLGFDVTSSAYWTDCCAAVDRQVALLASLID